MTFNPTKTTSKTRTFKPDFLDRSTRPLSIYFEAEYVRIPHTRPRHHFRKARPDPTKTSKFHTANSPDEKVVLSSRHK